MADTSQTPKDLIGFLDYYLVQKAPFQIPETGREMIVKFAPWILLVLLLITLPLVLFVLGLGTMVMPFGGLPYAAGFSVAAIFLVLYYILWIASMPGLFARRKSGWNLAFYGQLLSIVHSLVIGAILGAIVGGVIGLYLLFQVRTKYN